MRIGVECEFQCEMHVSSANFSVKSHFQMSPLRCPPLGRPEKNKHEPFSHKLFEHPLGSGSSWQENLSEVPSFKTQGKQTFEGGDLILAFRPPPLRMEDPHPTWKSPDPKGQTWCSCSCLILLRGGRSDSERERERERDIYIYFFL